MPVEVARTPTIQEAPVVDAEGNVFVSEFGGRVTKITPKGEASVWFESKFVHYGTGHILVFNSQGELISWMPGGEEGMSNIWVKGDQIYVTCGAPDKTDPDNHEKVSGVLYRLEKIKEKRAD